MKLMCSLYPYPNDYLSYLVLPTHLSYPLDMIPTRSHKASASSMRWVVKIIDVLCLHSNLRYMYCEGYPKVYDDEMDPILNWARLRIQSMGFQLRQLQLIISFAYLQIVINCECFSIRINQHLVLTLIFCLPASLDWPPSRWHRT